MREITEIKTSISEVKTIIHISDIHIRLFKRREEYAKVFENLYKELRLRRDDSTIAVIAGDVVHSKNELSPEMVRMTSDFLKKVADILPTILIPGNHDCYSPEHELLTKQGWINIKEYVESDTTKDVATFNSYSKEIEFQKPTDKIKKMFSGKMYNFIAKDADILVTPTHQILHTYSSTKRYYKKLAKDIKVNTLIPVNGIVNDHKDNAFYKLLGFTFAEGTFVIREHKKKIDRFAGCRVQFHLKNSREIEYLSNLLNILGYKFNVNKSEDSIYIRIYSNLGRKLCEFFDAKKEIPTSILESSISDMRNFIEGYLHGDGHKYKSKKNFWTYASISEKSVDLLHTMSRLVGASSHKDGRIIYGNYLNSKRQYGGSLNLNGMVNNTSIRKIEQIKYDGDVYCVSVPNGNLLLRRNGKICISGNCNLNNPGRLDALTPIVENIHHNNLFYIKDTGLYRIGEVVFSVMSIFDKKEAYIPAEDIGDNYTKVALFHGPVNNAITDLGYKVKNVQISMADFVGFDLAIFGDIHKKQMLSEFDAIRKLPAAGFSSSLIQQNHGEDRDGHGIYVWDVLSRTAQFVEIENEYGYVTLEITDGHVVSVPLSMPDRPRLRIKVANTDGAQLRDCLIELRKIYNPEEVSVNRISATVLEKDVEKVDFSSIRDVNFQNDLLKDYLQRSAVVDDVLLSKIYDINLDANGRLPQLEIARNVVWKPKAFEFSNMFSYGENNIIDFTKMKGVAGLFSPNASGKSSVLDALAFCLFDKCSRSSMAGQIMNSKTNNFWCKLNFEINGVDYFIVKTATRTKAGEDKAPVKIDFYKIMPDGSEKSLKGEDRAETSSIIRSYVGQFEDFGLTALSFQNDYATNFTEIGQADRKSLLIQFLDLGIFEQLEKIASEDAKEFTGLLKKYAAREFDRELSEIESEYDKYLNERKLVEVAKAGYVKSRDSYNGEILSLTKELIPVKTFIGDIYQLEKQQDSLKSKIKNAQELVADMKKEIVQCDSNDMKIKERLTQYEELKVTERFRGRERAITEKEKLQLNLSKVRSDTQHLMDRAAKNKTLEYDSNCDKCVKNMQIIDADYVATMIKVEESLKKALEMTGKETAFSKLIDDSVGVIAENKEMEEFQKMSTVNYNHRLQLGNRRSDGENKVLQYEKELQAVESDIETYYSSKDAIEKNKITNEKIGEVKTKLAEILREIKSFEVKEMNANARILFCTDKKKEIESELADYHEMESKAKAYTLYLQSIKKDGIPYELIAKSVPAIEAEINNILSQVADFTVNLELDGKNVNMRIMYSEDRFWTASLGSGMEKFLAGLAMRVALINVSTLPRPNFIAFDEGFTSLDAENRANIPTIFDYLRQQFDFTFIISHLDAIRDFVDVIVDLKKEDDFSKITFQ